MGVAHFVLLLLLVLFLHISSRSSLSTLRAQLCYQSGSFARLARPVPASELDQCPPLRGAGATVGGCGRSHSCFPLQTPFLGPQVSDIRSLPRSACFFFSCRWAVATRRAAPKVSTAPVVPTWAGESEPRPKAPLPAAGTRRGSRTRQLLRHECRSRTRLGSGYAQSRDSHLIEPSMNLLPVTAVRRSNPGSRSVHRGPSDGTTDIRFRSPIVHDARR